MTTEPSVPLSAFLRGVDRRADVRAAMLAPTTVRRDEQFELRPATDADRPGLERVAGRDSAVVPAGPLLLAEAAGEVIAAIGLQNRRVIADPFWPTARAVDALQAAAAEHSPWPARLRRLRSALPVRTDARRGSRAATR